MDIEEFRSYCLSKTAVTEGFPFDESTLVFKVLGKMFALADLNSDVLSVNLKCDPERAVLLRDEYSGVQPGYHQNKTHWNTVTMDGSVSSALMKEMTDHSYELVLKGLTKKQRELLARS